VACRHDQGCQFTAEIFANRLLDAGVAIGRDGKGRCLDNVFAERLWRSLKYEEVYLKGYRPVSYRSGATPILWTPPI